MPHISPNDWFGDDFFRVPVIAVLRGLTPGEAVWSATRAWDAGVEHVEVTIETAEAVPTLQAVVNAADERGLAVGAGTVITIEQMDAAASANASFTVSPGLDVGIIQESIRRGIPHLPGVSTASEILRARTLGLTWLKAFPASVLGPEWVKAMKGPFPDARFIATGGMKVATARTYLSAGVSVVGLSSDFSSDEGAAAVRDLLGLNPYKETTAARSTGTGRPSRTAKADPAPASDLFVYCRVSSRAPAPPSRTAKADPAPGE